MATIAQVRTLVENLYRDTWRTCFRQRPDLRPACLEVVERDGSSCFSLTENRLVIFVSTGNLDDRDILDPAAWPIWKGELIHELLHEWQLKTLCVATPAATLLLATRPANFQGPNHDATYYQAILEKAPDLGMTPEQLLPRL